MFTLAHCVVFAVSVLGSNLSKDASFGANSTMNLGCGRAPITRTNSCDVARSSQALAQVYADNSDHEGSN